MATKRSMQQMAANKKHAVQISLKFNKMNDYEVVQWLNRQPNKQAAIREAIIYFMDAEREGLI